MPDITTSVGRIEIQGGRRVSVFNTDTIRRAAPDDVLAHGEVATTHDTGHHAVSTSPGGRAGAGYRGAMLVWVSAWQQQCCGTRFATGGHVEWMLWDDPDVEWLTPVLGGDLATRVTHEEEHHGGRGDDAVATSGTVERIRAVSSSFRPDPAAGPEGGIVPVVGSRLVVDVHDADGFHPEDGGRLFVGYLVDLAKTATTATTKE